MKKLRKKIRPSPRVYARLLKKLVTLRRKGKRVAWGRVASHASACRARMVSANRTHSVDALPLPTYSPELQQEMPEEYRQWYRAILKDRTGRKALELSRKFWGVPYPPTIKAFNVGGKKMNFLTGMGWTNQVHVAKSRPGTNNPARKVKRKKIKGHWDVGCSPDGRTIYILSGSKEKRPWKFVGYAPETNYIPERELEEAGTFKAGAQWRHLHDDEGGEWPKVYADHGGRLGRFTNFRYGKGTYRIGKWIRR